LVLVGAGQAHVEVLRRFAVEPEPGVALMLIADERRSSYAEMLPGLVAGQYAEHDLTIDTANLAERAWGPRHHRTRRRGARG
jgi:selenide,water dikinase